MAKDRVFRAGAADGARFALQTRLGVVIGDGAH
jgi:hypothetical protein